MNEINPVGSMFDKEDGKGTRTRNVLQCCRCRSIKRETCPTFLSTKERLDIRIARFPPVSRILRGRRFSSSAVSFAPNSDVLHQTQLSFLAVGFSPSFREIHKSIDIEHCRPEVFFSKSNRSKDRIERSPSTRLTVRETFPIPRRPSLDNRQIDSCHRSSPVRY